MLSNMATFVLAALGCPQLSLSQSDRHFETILSRCLPVRDESNNSLTSATLPVIFPVVRRCSGECVIKAGHKDDPPLKKIQPWIFLKTQKQPPHRRGHYFYFIIFKYEIIFKEWNKCWSTYYLLFVTWPKHLLSGFS